MDIRIISLRFSLPRKKFCSYKFTIAVNGTETTWPVLKNVVVILLLPYTTAKLQPLHVGIIADVKFRDRKFQKMRELDLKDDGLQKYL